MARSFVELQTQSYGFEPEGILTVAVDLPPARYPNGTADHAPFYAELLERVAALPGIESAAGSSDLPAGSVAMTFSFAIEGRPRPGPTPREEPEPLRIVTPAYFPTLGIPVLDGRAIEGIDNADSPAVVVINDALRRLHWPDESPIGKRISFEGPAGPWLEIIGVVGDTRDYSMDASFGPAMYLPLAQKSWDWASWLNLVVRTTGEPESASAGVLAVLADLDKQIVPGRIATLTDLYAETNARRRLATILIFVFAGFGLLIGAIGVHGLMAASVARRTKEIGIRMAIGAERREVLLGVVREGVTPAAAGTALGLVGAFALTRFLETLVYGVGTRDPVTFLTVSLLMMAVAGMAAYLPARQATRINPSQALRAE
jgi:predicted permease